MASGPFLFKRASNAEIDITDGVTRTPLAAAVAAEWATILGIGAPGYTTVSDALWNSIPANAAAPPPPPPAPPPPSPTSPWPTASTTGVPTGTSLTVRTTMWRTTAVPAAPTGSELIGGKSYHVITNSDFRASTQYLYVDEPYVVFRRCKFSATGAVSNGMALVQQSSASLAVIWEDCTFDGGASQNRGISGDYGDFTVTRCNFTRCGEACVEKNDRTGQFSMYVTDSYVNQVKGWPSAQHVDGLQMDGGKNFTAKHNTIWMEPYGGTNGDTGYVSNSCIGVWSTLGNMTGTILIDNNQLAGGGSVIYVQQGGYTMSGSVTISNNRFDRTHFPSLQGGQYNPTSGHAAVWYVLYPNGVPDQLSWSSPGGNKWEDGTAITYAVATAST